MFRQSRRQAPTPEEIYNFPVASFPEICYDKEKFDGLTVDSREGYAMRKIISLLLVLLLLAVPVWADGTGQADAQTDTQTETQTEDQAQTEAQSDTQEADEAEPQDLGPLEIRSVEDLLAVAEDPEGSYVLAEDLDMEGQEWIPFAFSGTLDGGGHSILNLSLTKPGEDFATAYDGNQKEYDAVYCGLFSMLQNAEVKNLNLVNVRGLIEAFQPCLAGPIAGYCMDSTITNCKVSGQLELRAFDGMFGLGGFVGYGVGDIVGCSTDITLICVDTDESTMDEQFLGGAYATGFMTVTECDIKLDAYISEHGYVHSGGIVGMLMQYPIGMGHSALLTDNTISGQISFFEHNTSRRAYCGKVYGELMKAVNYNYRIVNNEGDIAKNETSDYTQELRPEKCENPEYKETVVDADCTHFGYTEYVCKGCGYTYWDHYTLYTHTVSTWTVVTPATTEHTGESVGKCDVCGAEQSRVDPILPEPEPEPETEPETQPETEPETEPETQPETEPTTQPETIPEPEPEPEGKGSHTWILAVLGIAAVAAAVVVWRMLSYKPQHAKKRK